MKVVIPVAGAGTKLRPFTYTQPKALIPLAGKTILSFIIDQLVDAGLNDFIFIIGHLGEKIQDFVADKYPHINAEFVVQGQREGTGHAVLLAQKFVKENEEILIVFGDTICDCAITEVINNKNSCLVIKKVANPVNFGIVELNEDNKVLHVLEKPKVPKSNLALVGLYKIVETKLLFDIIAAEFSKESEELEKYHLTNALETMIQKGVHFNTYTANNWYDCGQKQSLLETNAGLLKKLEFASDEVPFFENTIIIHPVSIAEGCDIQNSIIGPNVTVGENANINSSIISNSIIGSYSQLTTVVMHDSLIGSDAFVRGHSQSLNIGDNTEIDLK
jgi:glucose-1-phosphate thymidylyltransferase